METITLTKIATDEEIAEQYRCGSYFDGPTEPYPLTITVVAQEQDEVRPPVTEEQEEMSDGELQQGVIWNCYRYLCVSDSGVIFYLNPGELGRLTSQGCYNASVGEPTQ